MILGCPPPPKRDPLKRSSRPGLNHSLAPLLSRDALADERQQARSDGLGFHRAGKRRHRQGRGDPANGRVVIQSMERRRPPLLRTADAIVSTSVSLTAFGFRSRSSAIGRVTGSTRAPRVAR